MPIAHMSSRLRFFQGTTPLFQQTVIDTQAEISTLSTRINNFMVEYPWRNFGVRNIEQIPEVQEAINDGNSFLTQAQGICKKFPDHGKSFIAVAEYSGADKILLNFVRKNVAHEISHAVCFAFEDNMLHDDPRFIAAYNEDLSMARATANAAQQISQIYPGHPQADIDLDFIALQLDEEEGRKEVWANHLTHFLLKEPYYKVVPGSYSKSLDIVGTQADQLQLIARTDILWVLSNPISRNPLPLMPGYG